MLVKLVLKGVPSSESDRVHAFWMGGDFVYSEKLVAVRESAIVNVRCAKLNNSKNWRMFLFVKDYNCYVF